MDNALLITNVFEKEEVAFNGNKFLLGNGYFGVRGTMEEYKKENMPAINLAGIYDKVEGKWRESVNAPNPLYTYIKINGEAFELPEKEPYSHYQSVNIETAVHTRKTVWETENGKITVVCEKFASMANQHLIAMKYSVLADYDCDVEIITGIDGDVWDINGPHFVKIIPETDRVTGITGEKKITVITEQNVSFDFECESDKYTEELSAYRRMKVYAKANDTYTFTKIACISTSYDDFDNNDNILDLTYENEKQKHILAWADIWNMSYIEIDGDEEAEFALNYSIYHLNCIAPRNMKNKSIAARGLSGQVYKGAVFWDTEMFMIDYYIYTEPEIAKTLLQYRIDTIDGARRKAKEYNLEGAYYAWESQEGGFEGCSNYNIVDVFTKRPMRTYFRDKQYHVSAAIVYGFMKYIDATGDYKILEEGGLNVIIECAQMYRSLLLKRADKEQYEIHDVVGPDEYHERVNNNAYTNRIVKFVFETAVKMVDYAKKNNICVNYDLDNIKKVMSDSAEKMFTQSPNKNGIIEQFDGYFSLEDVSVNEVRSRLLDPKEYWGGAYGVASDTQVLKQADVVAMLSMFKNDYNVDIMKKNFDYYEPRTEHGSSLSTCMYSLLACFTNNPDLAYPLFMKSAKTDLTPGGKEWLGLIYIGGTHPASEGGAWIVAIKGFAGISIKDGSLVCEPNLPKHWNSMSFKLKFKDKFYKITVDKSSGKVEEIW